MTCIAGMHRSGSSLVARLMGALGVYLGPAAHLKARTGDDLNGLGQHGLLAALNDEILGRLGGTWHDPPLLVSGWEDLPELADLRRRARRMIDEDFGSVETWAWSDPRMSFTLPFWRRLTPALSCVICLRDPTEVAESLGRREGLAFEKGVGLWVAHVTSALANTSGGSRLFVFYEDMMLDWQRELRRVARFVGRAGLAERTEIQRAVEGLVAEERQCHPSPSGKAALSPQLASLATSLYVVLRLYAGQREDEGAVVRNLEPAAAAAAVESLSAAAMQAQADLARLRLELDERTRELQERRRELEWHVRELAARSAELGAMRRTHDAHEAELERIRTAFGRINRHPVWRAFLGVRLGLIPRNSRREALYWTLRHATTTLTEDGVVAFLRQGLSQLRRGGFSLARFQGFSEYERWLKTHELTPAAVARLREEGRSFPYQPRISIVTPVYNVAEIWLRRAIDSVRGQAYENWELCLINDGSSVAHVRAVLDDFAGREPRIKVLHLPDRTGIVGASNQGLSMATGEFVGFLDHDDELYPNALFEVVALLNRRRDVDVIYSDEDKIERDGRRSSPFFKPDWCPDLLLSMNYVCHFSVCRRVLLQEAGGFREGFGGSQDYDLILRLSEVTTRIAHIPKVLYGWRKVAGSAAGDTAAKPYAYVAAVAALREALTRRGIEGEVEAVAPSRYRVRRAIQGRPRISIVIPMKDKSDLTRRCVESIESRSGYGELELVVVDNGSVEEASQAYLAEVAKRHRVLRYDEPFNYSIINNLGARQASGSYLLFLNNDTEVVSRDWLEAMLEHAQRREVGAVGARLVYPFGRVQHAGVFIAGTPTGFALHAFRQLPATSPGYFGLAESIRNWSAVTAACMMVRRAVFEEVGGFDERLRVAFNDVDFCLRLRERGYLVVYTPFATLIHHESATRKALHPAEDEEYVRRRWREIVLNGDPYYNPNLTRVREDFGLDV